MQVQNTVGYFEIPVSDFERAIMFYEHVNVQKILFQSRVDDVLPILQ